MLSMVYSDIQGHLFVDDELAGVGRLGKTFWQLEDDEVIPLPEGADVMLLPDRLPVGVASDGTVQILDAVEGSGDRPLAVAAALPVGYTRTYLPGFERELGAGPLPLFGYTAVVSRDGVLCGAALLTDDPSKWAPEGGAPRGMARVVRQKIKASPRNRILEHLGRCAQEYHCCTAQNVFYCRWEAGIPISRSCNASCLGCISLQPSECCPSPQARIDFTPSVAEIVEVAVAHLEGAEDAIVSFGQGCEGDPLTEGLLLCEAVREIRRQTSRGTINMNTNAGLTGALASVVDAGLDSIRVSLFSPISDEYSSYHRPHGYALTDVAESMRMCGAAGVDLSVNLLTFPGVTDDPLRVDALVHLLRASGVGLVQLRNLNLDPDALFDAIGIRESQEPLGIRGMIARIIEEVPGARVGNYSKPRA